MSWTSFSQKEPKGWEEHEEYSDWKIWEEVPRENSATIEKLQICLAK